MDNGRGEELELRDYIEVLLRHKWIIIFSFLITAFSAGIGALFLVKPTYEATALLMVSRPGYQVELEPKIKTPIPLEISLETYRNLIKSPDLEEKVINQLNLGQPPHNLTIEDLDEMVFVEAVPKTDLIKIKVKSDSPVQAKEIVNTWVSLFLKENKELNSKETKEAQSFIENQLEISEQNLFLAEEELRKFNEISRINSLKKEIEEKLTRMMGYELRLADVGISLKKEEAKLSQIKRQMAIQEKILTSTDISQLTAGMKYSETKDFIEKQLELTRKKLDDKEEELKKFNEESRILILKKEIDDKIGRIINLQGRLTDLKVLIKGKEAELNQAKEWLAKEPETFILTKSIYDDASFNQLTSELTHKEALLLKNLKFKSETLNPLYTALRSRVVNLKIDLDRYQSEAAQLAGNITILSSRLEEAKKEYAAEQLKQTSLEREVDILRKTYKTLASKAEEVRIATAIPSLQEKATSPTNPEYLKLQAELINCQINQEELLAEKDELAKYISNYQARIGLLKKELATEELAKSRLERTHNTTNSIYEVVSQKAAEIKIAMATETGTIKIVSLAHEPKETVGPGKKKIIGIGGILGLFLGVFIAFFSDYWEKTEKRKGKADIKGKIIKNGK